MRKDIAFIVLCMLCIVLISVLGHSSTPEIIPVQPAVYEKFTTNSTVPVIITFRKPSGVHLFSSQSTSERVSARIRTNSPAFGAGNTVAASVTREELNSLIAEGTVEYVAYNHPISAFLQQSAGIVNASVTWPKQITSSNLTGINQTICVIDTGVNYSHSALGGCFGNNNASSTCKVVGGYDFVNNDNDPIDDQGHGTHAAGIAAANGNITGIAPEARIVAVKVLDSGGGGSTADMVKGIEWCVGNASLLNITVISMSLGVNCYTDATGCYTNACDAQETPSLAAAINNATLKNISVVIATGNNGNTTAISSPACIQNAIRVGAAYDANLGGKSWYTNSSDDGTHTCTDATTSQDKIACFTNRNALLLLMAPGSEINSTIITGSYTADSGTSMAVPHAAGAIAILNQFLRLTGQTRTPQQIESALNSTGKRMADSTRNYSRIDIYSALMSLDVTAPNVTLVSPANGTTTTTVNQTFICNATDLSLRNVTFYLWNASSTVNQTFRNANGAAESIAFNITALNTSDYIWNCEYADENNNRAFAASNFSLSVTSLTTTLISPANATITNRNQTFSCNATTTSNLTNVTFYLWNASSTENITLQTIGGLTNSTNFTVNFPREGNYSWNCLYANTLNTHQFATANLSITYDVTIPIVTVVAPNNGSWQAEGRFNTTLNENGMCFYSLDSGVTNVTMSSMNNLTFNATNTSLVQNANYTARYYCNDSAGNANLSTLSSFSVDMILPNVTLYKPAESYAETASSSILFFNYSASDNLNISSCSLILNSVTNLTNSSITNQSVIYNFTQTLAADTYVWNISCIDIAGNIGTSATRTATITAPVSASSPNSGGGGGGGGGTPGTAGLTYKPSPADVQQGYNRILKKADKVQFALSTTNENHTLTVENVSEDFVNLTIRSEPIVVLLRVGQRTKLNVSSTTHYDLALVLASIAQSTANITIQAINEPIENEQSPATLQQVNNTLQSSENMSNTSAPENMPRTRREIFVVGTILLVLVIGAIIYVRRRMRQVRIRK